MLVRGGYTSTFHRMERSRFAMFIWGWVQETVFHILLHLLFLIQAFFPRPLSLCHFFLYLYHYLRIFYLSECCALGQLAYSRFNPCFTTNVWEKCDWSQLRLFCCRGGRRCLFGRGRGWRGRRRSFLSWRGDAQNIVVYNNSQLLRKLVNDIFFSAGKNSSTNELEGWSTK